MGFFDQNFKNDPIVVNCAQNLEYVDNYHVGTLDDSREGEVYGSGAKRRQVKWTPRDTVDGDPDIFPTTIRKEHYVSFAPGTISPRAVVWLLPDKFSELPDQMKHSDLGLVFSEFYKNKGIERALKVVAESEPEIMDKIRMATRNSELDDQVRKAVSNVMDDVEKAARLTDNKNSSSSSES